MDQNPKDEAEIGIMKKIPYSHAVGSLIYAATHTLPDIATARDSSLLGSNMRLCGYSDSAWAGCADAKRSTLGYAFLLPTGLISWNAGSPKLRREYISRTSQNIELRVLKG
ncbi:hypothetical protein V1508DRAFT_434173 [Lipomyces doorenjongii]|uniref:uncharacterized protein n=1 Tax=Lipomyces doorenjongii TaxID=383834 RepID=UPI0034CF4ADD